MGEILRDRRSLGKHTGTPMAAEVAQRSSLFRERTQSSQRSICRVISMAS